MIRTRLSRHVTIVLLSAAALSVAAVERAAAQARPSSPQAQEQGAKAQRQPGGRPATTGAAGSAGAAAGRAAGGHQATLLGTFGDWNAYVTQTGRSKICYALSQPKERLPSNLNRDPAYLFVSFRPAENVRNEVAVVMGFPTKEGGDAQAVVGDSTFELVTKDENVWVRNPAEEGQLVNAFVRGQSLLLKVTSRRGNETTDRYSLIGFTQAVERARSECQ